MPTPVFLPGEVHGQRSLAGYSPWGRKSQTRLKRLSSSSSSLVGKESACNAEDPGSIPGLGRSAGEGIFISPQPKGGTL